MKQFTIAIVAVALPFAAAGCAGMEDSYERAAEDAEWYDAYYADKRRCDTLGGALVVEKDWATRLEHELRPGARYSCHLRHR